MDYDRRKAEFAKDTGPVRRGIGVASFWYNTGVYPISLETASNRMQLNLDGTVTSCSAARRRSARAADTAYAQMAAKAVGLKSYKDVHVVSCQDTDITPFGTGRLRLPPDLRRAASPSTRPGGSCGRRCWPMPPSCCADPAEELDIVDGQCRPQGQRRGADGPGRSGHGRAQYNLVHSEHITAESTATIQL